MSYNSKGSARCEPQFASTYLRTIDEKRMAQAARKIARAVRKASGDEQYIARMMRIHLIELEPRWNPEKELR